MLREQHGRIAEPGKKSRFRVDIRRAKTIAFEMKNKKGHGQLSSQKPRQHHQGPLTNLAKAEKNVSAAKSSHSFEKSKKRKK